jgi:hypothetical protein
LHVHAAVDRQIGASDEAGVVRAGKRNQRGNFVGLAAMMSS